MIELPPRSGQLVDQRWRKVQNTASGFEQEARGGEKKRFCATRAGSSGSGGRPKAVIIFCLLGAARRRKKEPPSRSAGKAENCNLANEVRKIASEARSWQPMFGEALWAELPEMQILCFGMQDKMAK